MKKLPIRSIGPRFLSFYSCFFGSMLHLSVTALSGLEKAIKNCFFLIAFTLRESERTRREASNLIPTTRASSLVGEFSWLAVRRWRIAEGPLVPLLGPLVDHRLWSSRQGGTRKAGQKSADPKTGQTNETAPIPRTCSLKVETDASGCALGVLSVFWSWSPCSVWFSWFAGLVLVSCLSRFFLLVLSFSAWCSTTVKPDHLSEGAKDIWSRYPLVMRLCCVTKLWHSLMARLQHLHLVWSSPFLPRSVQMFIQVSTLNAFSRAVLDLPCYRGQVLFTCHGDCSLDQEWENVSNVDLSTGDLRSLAHLMVIFSVLEYSCWTICRTLVNV